MKITCSKLFEGFPFAHRQPSHDGHCAWIHGHTWSFKYTFECDRLEEGSSFVVDFGKLKWLKQWLDDNFDHTLVLNMDDPALEYLRAALEPTAFPVNETRFRTYARIIVVPNCGAEGLAIFLLATVNRELCRQNNERNVRCTEVTVWENERNSATAVYT